MIKSFARALTFLMFITILAEARAAVGPAQAPAAQDWQFQQTSAAEAKTLEDGLKTNPDDLAVRERLIAYYFRAGIEGRDPGLEDRREQHVFWLIENHPEAEIAGSPEGLIIFSVGTESAEGYQRAKQLWLDQTAKHSDDVKVLRNASYFFSMTERKIGKDLLDKAYALDPEDPKTLSLLAQWYNGEWIYARSREGKQAAAQKALSFQEKLLDKANPQERFYMLDEATKYAIEAGENAKAEQYATELLASAEKNQNDWNYGNALNIGNVILGRVALQRGDMAGAREHLLAAGNVAGSPQLDSFGPDMSLAKELFAKGDRDTVLAYLQSCGKFWKMGADKLQKWIAIIKGGGTPDFDVMSF